MAGFSRIEYRESIVVLGSWDKVSGTGIGLAMLSLHGLGSRWNLQRTLPIPTR